MNVVQTDGRGWRLPFLAIRSLPSLMSYFNSIKFVMNIDGGNSGSNIFTTVDVCLHDQIVAASISEDDLFSDRMNIFVLSDDPTEAGQMLCDTHVCQMSVEYAQLLCNAQWAQGTPNPFFKQGPTRTTHPNSLWVCDSVCNYQWLLALTCAVWDEYKYRYNQAHDCDASLREFLSRFAGPAFSTSTVATPPPQCIPDDYRISQTVAHANRWRNTVLAYRDYYVNEKYRNKNLRTGIGMLAKWTRREPPNWYVQRAQELEFDAVVADTVHPRKFKVIVEDDSRR